MPIPTTPEALKPCPFCDGKADVDQPVSSGKERLVFCKVCFASICEDSTPNAIAAWNRRPSLRESVSVTLTETDRSDLRVAANIIDRDGPSPIGVELAATLRRIAGAGVQEPPAPCPNLGRCTYPSCGHFLDVTRTTGVDVPGEGQR